MRARGLFFTEPRRVELREVDVPEPGPGEVLVRTEWSGISGGTEMLAYRGQIDPELPLDETLGALAGTFTHPFPYGYACVGRVERSGAGEEDRLVFAFHPHQDRFVVRAEDVVGVDGVDPRQATLYPLVETALQVCLDAAPRYSELACVLGLGAVGILTSALLARSGARVIASEPDPVRRAAAGAFGVHAVSPGDLPDAVGAATEGRGADLLVEASGSPPALGDGLGLLAHEGTALVCSWYGTKEVPLPLGAEFHRRRLVVRSTQVSTLGSATAGRWDRERRRREARRLLGELPLHVLATHAFPFERAAEAYAVLDRGEEGLVHAALRYE